MFTRVDIILWIFLQEMLLVLESILDDNTLKKNLIIKSLTFFNIHHIETMLYSLKL